MQKTSLASIHTNYRHTINACYIGYITQAIVNNFAPLLFLTFARDYNLGLDKITLITTLNFGFQLFIDFVSAKFIDKIGYRVSIVLGHVCAVLGLVLLAVLPDMLAPSGHAYTGILISVLFYAVGGGVTEVLISPIVEACPTDNKEAAMSLLHSFYCWGFVFVILMSTVFFHFAGVNRWRVLALLWALIPLVNTFYFSLVPIYPVVAAEERQLSISALVKNRLFWLIVVMMVCAGASEQAVGQWVSAFAESALHVGKTVGDLAGPCAFAFMQGLSRLIYGKRGEHLPLKKAMLSCALLCVASYLLIVFAPHPVLALIACALTGFAVGIFWPGTFSMAALAIPGGGTAMYALLALAGDLGCSGGPTLTGFVANAAGGRLPAGIAAAIVFPALMFALISILRERK